MGKYTVVITLLVIALVLSLSLVSAADPIIAEQDVSPITAFWNNLIHSISTEQFSVVGDARSCGGSGGSSNYDWLNIQSGQRVSSVATGTYNGLPVIDVNSYSCPSGSNKLYNVFTNGWTAFAEFKGTLDFVCGSSPCNVEVYCCPDEECSSDSDCDGGTCTTVQCTNPVIKGGNTYYFCPGESQIPYEHNSYSYCTQATTMKCYYKKEGTCSESYTRTYDKNLFPNFCESYTYEGGPLYSSLSACSGTSGCTIDRECPSGKVCSNGNCVTPEPSDIPDDVPSDIPSDVSSDIPDAIEEPDIKSFFQILDVSYGDSLTGQPVTNPIPGQLLKVSFKVRDSRPPVEFSAFPGKLYEVGIIPLETAKEWGMAEPSGFFSLFAIGENKKDSCCQGQSNVASNIATVPLTSPDVRIEDFVFDIKVPDSQTTDLCGSETYWDGTKDYVLYVIVKNGCYKDGYRKGVFVSEELTLDMLANETTVGKVCTEDFECAPGEKCLDKAGDFRRIKYCTFTGITAGESYHKYPLTKEEIGKSTTADLISAACYSKSECSDREDYTISCIPTSKLTDDGTLTKAQVDDLFSSGKATITTGVIGAGVGTGICVLGIATGAFTGGVTTIIGCGAAGALTLVGVTQATTAGISNVKYLFSDELTRAIEKGDSSKVGICTAEKSLDIGAWIKSLGSKINITGNAQTDGFIVLIVGFILVMVLLNTLFKKK